MNVKPLLAVLLCSLATAASAATNTALPSITIDFRYNTQADDGKNYVAWKMSGTKTRDHYDAVTGASVSRATQTLAAVVTNNKRKIAPKGLRALLLFAASAATTASTDALTVTQNGKQLTIQFVHRGVAYRITSDARGRIDIADGFLFAENIAENKRGVFTAKREALPGGKPPKSDTPPDEDSAHANTTALNSDTAPPSQTDSEADASGTADTEPTTAEGNADDRSAVADTSDVSLDATASPATDDALKTDDETSSSEPAYEPPPYDGDATDMRNIAWENLDLLPDRADSKAAQCYSGILRTRYKNGILTVRGTLKSASPATDN